MILEVRIINIWQKSGDNFHTFVQTMTTKELN